jgi:hypothetical protein
LPVGTLWWTSRCSSSRVVSTISGRIWGGLVGSHKSGKVGKFADGGSSDFDKTVFGTFLDIFVHEATRVDGCHISAIEGSYLFEFTSVGVATVFRKARYLLANAYLMSKLILAYKMGSP